MHAFSIQRGSKPIRDQLSCMYVYDSMQSINILNCSESVDVVTATLGIERMYNIRMTVFLRIVGKVVDNASS